MHKQEPIYFAPQHKFGGGWICYKDSPSAPAAPDYAGAARETNTSARTNQYTPYGNQVWTPGTEGTKPTPGYVSVVGNNEDGTPKYQWIDGSPGTAAVPWSSTISLNPEAQKALDAQLKLSSSLGDFATGQVSGVKDSLSKPFDMGGVQDIYDKAYSTQTARLDPQWKQNEQMNDTQLSNQGIMRGSEAYDNAKREFGQQKNDAYQQAEMGAIATMPQTFQLGTSARELPLNELNALRTGAQVNNPQFSGTGAGANMLGAAQSQGQYAQGIYGSDVATTNSQNATTAASAAAIIAAMI